MPDDQQDQEGGVDHYNDDPPGPALLDELGYVQLDARSAELVFQVITERREKASIGLATNLPFSEGGTVFPDPRLVAAIVDRVTFNAHILETGTQSYGSPPARTPRGASERSHANQEVGP